MAICMIAFSIIFFILPNFLTTFPLEDGDNSMDRSAMQLPIETRLGLVNETYRWKNGVIPFEIAVTFPEDSLNMISRAMNLFKKYTCVSFRSKVSTDTDYISITNDRGGCWSPVGKTGGRQLLNLDSPSCTNKIGVPLHELMHAVGFFDEVNRYDRDRYVQIKWDKILEALKDNFRKPKEGTARYFGVPYDFRSVMHFSNNSFGAGNDITILPSDPNELEKIGQRDGFSKGDITRINNMHKCPEKTAEVALRYPSNILNNSVFT